MSSTEEETNLGVVLGEVAWLIIDSNSNLDIWLSPFLSKA